MTPEQISQMDQDMALVVETYPSMWWNLFSGCKKQGFTEQQSLELVKTFMNNLSVMAKG